MCTTQQQEAKEKMTTIKKETNKDSPKNLLDFVVFNLLKLKPMQVTQIIGQIYQNMGIKFELNNFSPLLNNIESYGIIAGKWNLVDGRPRKIYSLTTEGNQITNSIKNEFNNKCQEIIKISNL